MTRDEAIERVVWAVEQMVRSQALRGTDRLYIALRDLLDASEQHLIARGETTGPWSADE